MLYINKNNTSYITLPIEGRGNHLLIGGDTTSVFAFKLENDISPYQWRYSTFKVGEDDNKLYYKGRLNGQFNYYILSYNADDENDDITYYFENIDIEGLLNYVDKVINETMYLETSILKTGIIQFND